MTTWLRFLVERTPLLKEWERKRLLALDEARLAAIEAAFWADPTASAADIHSTHGEDIGASYNQVRLLRRVLGFPPARPDDPDSSTAAAALEEWAAAPVSSIDPSRATIERRMREDGCSEEMIRRLLP